MNKYNAEGYADPTVYEALTHMESGFLPIAPQLLFPQFMNDDIPQERDTARFMGMVLLTKCTELWVFGTQTAGMKAEVAKAKRKQMKVRTFTDRMEEQV